MPNRGFAEHEKNRNHAASAHLLLPFVNNYLCDQRGVRLITHADGIYVWDDSGKRYLDAFAGLWCVNVGYGRRELAEAAREQMNTLPYYNMFFDTVTQPAAQLAKTLSELAPAHVNTVFFTNSGSEANDSLYRMVRHYWQLAGQPQKKIIIARDNAYHGSTTASASMGGMKPMHAQGDLPIAGIHHIMQPYPFELAHNGESSGDFGLRAARALEDKILALGPENVGAFVAEPVQGAGGVIIPPDTYWPEIQRIVKRYDLLLAVDEVVCGFGRTGRWFGCDTFAIQADFMTVAKGLSSGYLPMGGLLLADRVAAVLKSREAGEFLHGFTYSGHPVCAAVALANLTLLQQEHVVEDVHRVKAPHFTEALQSLADHPLVGEARSVGLLGAIELVADKNQGQRYPGARAGALCRDNALEHGLVLRATGDTMLFSPPLVITPNQIDEMIALTRMALDRTLLQLTSST